MRNSEADNSEHLVQRFIDNDLSSAERVQLLMRLGRDGALQERLIELEQLAAGAGRLPRPAVPADFVAGVMARTQSRLSFGRRLQEILWAPHPFQWNLAGAARRLRGGRDGTDAVETLFWATTAGDSLGATSLSVEPRWRSRRRLRHAAHRRSRRDCRPIWTLGPHIDCSDCNAFDTRARSARHAGARSADSGSGGRLQRMGSRADPP